MAMRSKEPGEILVEMGAVTQQQSTAALAGGKASRRKLGEELVGRNICTEDQIAAALTAQLGAPQVDLRVTPIDPQAGEAIPVEIARKHTLVPFDLDGKILNVAMADPLDLDAIEDVQFVSGFRLRPHIATPTRINCAIDKHYGLSGSIDSLVKDPASEETFEVCQEEGDGHDNLGELRKQSEVAQIIKMVNSIITSAARRGASDVHIEPCRTGILVRQRIDGNLRLVLELPKWAQSALVSRTKVMASLDIAEKRVPLDCRIGVRMGKQTLDMRISTLPTNHGEKVVIRLLEGDSALRSIERLGFDREGADEFLSLIGRSQGIVLITGPTGSGKTTTLYAALAHIKCVERNITTIEDPIEYELDGINQTSINERAGQTFANVLPAILRQDPDVILVGEMRDKTTATLAMQAALTGHWC